MPVAYVRFINGPMSGKKTIVDITRIKHFNQKVHKSNVKYKIDYNNHECCGVILLQADSKEELQKIIENKDKRRLPNLPSKLLVSAPSDNDLSDIENNASKSILKTRNVAGTNKNVLLEKQLQNKLSNLKSRQPNIQKSKSSSNVLKKEIINHTVTEGGTENAEKIIEENEKNSDDQRVVLPKCNPDDKNGNIIHSESNPIDKDDKQEENATQSKLCNNSQEAKKEQSELHFESTNNEVEGQNNIHDQFKENEKETIIHTTFSVPELKKQKDDHNESEIMNPTMSEEDIGNAEKKIEESKKKSDERVLPKVLRKEPVKIILQTDPKQLKNNNGPAMTTDEINVLKEKVKKLKAENLKLSRRKKELKSELEEKNKNIKKLMDLNENLQNHLIEKCVEQKDKINELENVKESSGYDSNFPSFLKTRITDKISRVHIGNDEWIPEMAFNRIKSKSSTARQLAGNILIAVFDEDILLTSTISGYESNKKGKDNNKKRVNKLDEKKLTACEKLYEYLLENLFSKFKSTKKVQGKLVKVTIEDEKGLFQYYAQKKIADLKTYKAEESNSERKKRKRKDIDQSRNGSDSDDQSAVKKVHRNLEVQNDDNITAGPSDIVTQKATTEKTLSEDETVESEKQDTELDGQFFDWSPDNPDTVDSTSIASDNE